tara:strand:+ start:245 stop:781 length:537 start_codon:yes stop_codon:yes gene_type:complete
MSLIRSGGLSSLNVSTTNSFDFAGSVGMAYARSLPITIAAGQSNSIKIQKNSKIAVRFIRANGLKIDAVYGSVSGDIIGLYNLISTNGINNSDFSGSIEIYNEAAIGESVISGNNSLNESLYPDGQYVFEVKNNTLETISTALTVGVEQISESGVYAILEPNTQIEPTTEMSDYNGVN